MWVPGEIPAIDYGLLQLEQIDIVRQIIDGYPDIFELPPTADDIERIYQAGLTRI